MTAWAVVGLIAGAGLYLLTRATRWRRFEAREQYKSDLRAIAMRKQMTAALRHATVRVHTTVATTPKDQP